MRSTLCTLILLPSKSKLWTYFSCQATTWWSIWTSSSLCLLAAAPCFKFQNRVSGTSLAFTILYLLTVPRLQPMHDGVSEAWGAAEGDRRQWSLPRRRSNDTWFETLWRSQTAEGIIFLQSRWHTPTLFLFRFTSLSCCMLLIKSRRLRIRVHSYGSGRYCIPRTVNKFNLSWNVMGGLFSSTKLALLLRTCHHNFVAPCPASCATANSYDIDFW